MTRRFLRITLVNGKQIEREIPPMKEMPIGAPANHPFYMNMAMTVATSGFCEDAGAREPRWIAPAYIREVEIVFQGKDVETPMQVDRG